MKTSILKYLRKGESFSKLKYLNTYSVKCISHLTKISTLVGSKANINKPNLVNGLFSIPAKNFAYERTERSSNNQNRQNSRVSLSQSNPIYKYRTVIELNDCSKFSDYIAVISRFEQNTSAMTKEEWEDIFVAVSIYINNLTLN